MTGETLGPSQDQQQPGIPTDPPIAEQFGYHARDHQYEGVVARNVLAWIMNALPRELVNEDQTRIHLEQLAELRRQGYGGIVPYPHFSRRETFEVPRLIVSEHDELHDVPLSTPLALHQNSTVLKIIGPLTNLDRNMIVTQETVNKGKNIIKPPLSVRAKDIFLGKINSNHEPQKPQVLRRGYGLRDYLEGSSQALAEQGIVFVAPQGGRKTSLGEPEHTPIESLITYAEKKGIDKIAIMPVAVSLKDAEEYTEETMGYNLRRTYQLQAGVPRTIDEYRAHADSNENTIDQQVFADLAEMLPDTYVNPKLIYPIV